MSRDLVEAREALMAGFRRELRRMDMPRLLERLAEARWWWDVYKDQPGATNIAPLIEEEIRVRF